MEAHNLYKDHSLQVNPPTAGPAQCPQYRVFAQLPQPVLITNSHGQLHYWNQAFANLPPCAAQPLLQQGTSLHQLFDHQAAGLLQALAANQMPVTHTDFQLASVNYTCSYAPYGDKHSDTLHFFQLLQQDGYQPLYQKACERKEFYKNILRHLPSDVSVISTDFRYLYVNNEAGHPGSGHKWLVGKTDIDYCQHYQMDMAIATNRKNIYQAALQTKRPVEWEEEMANSHGQVEYLLRKVKPVLDAAGEVKYLIGYGLNITERRQIEDRIQISEKRYRDLFNYSQALICTHDLNGNLMTVNPALCETLGYAEDEIVGHNLEAFLSDDDRQHLLQEYLLPMASQPKTKGVFRVINKQGHEVYLLYTNFKVEEPNTPPYIIGFAHNISDRIQAERELEQAKKITEQTALLKERFLANVSHEIRTPMNGIIGITGLLQKTPLDTEQKQYLKIINDSAENLLTIINDILDLEKIAAGEVKIEEIPFEIVDKTTSALSLFDFACRQKGVQLQFDNRLGERLVVIGDPTRYNQILNNLLSNAVKFTSSGNITLQAATRQNNHHQLVLEVSVSDTGIGMEESQLTKIFEPFTQAYPETTRKYGGTGLGLAITKNLVELQGGSILVKSVPGYGSKFTFTINYQKPEEQNMTCVETEMPTPITSLGAIKVLLAEDNEVNQLLARSILMYWGLETKVAVTGNEVVDLVQREDFDVILMDIQMPEKSGLEATLDIRAMDNEKKRNIPIIALTANALKGEEKKYIAVGMDDFLTKPFKENELHEVISRVLSNKGAFGRNLHQYQGTLATTKIMHEPTTEERLYDMNSLNEVSRGNSEFLVTLARIFLKTIPQNSVEMVEAAEAKNWDKVSALAHKLKSTIDTMNIQAIRQDIRAIEINAKNKADLQTVCVQVQKVNDIIAKTAIQLKEHFSL